MTYAQQLARFITGLSAHDLSGATRLKTSHCLMDYMAAAWNAQGHALAPDIHRPRRSPRLHTPRN